MRLEERIAGHPNKINFPTNFNKSITAAIDFFFFFFVEKETSILTLFFYGISKKYLDTLVPDHKK